MCPGMVVIPAGQLMMGLPSYEEGRSLGRTSGSQIQLQRNPQIDSKFTETALGKKICVYRLIPHCPTHPERSIRDIATARSCTRAGKRSRRSRPANGGKAKHSHRTHRPAPHTRSDRRSHIQDVRTARCLRLRRKLQLCHREGATGRQSRQTVLQPSRVSRPTAKRASKLQAFVISHLDAHRPYSRHFPDGSSS